MVIRRRFTLFLTVGILATIFLVLRRSDNTAASRISSWRPKLTNPGAGAYDSNGSKPDTEADNPQAQEPPRILTYQGKFPTALDSAIVSNDTSPFSPGTAKTAGSTYTKAVVLGRLQTEDTTWLEKAEFPSTILKYIYDVDPSNSKPSSLLQLPKLKGHEAMVYLTYIIDHYSNLPDIVIFMHAHQFAWHNLELLNYDAIEMISRLSAERVTREGYMNLRCLWGPGCPDQIHPRSPIPDPEKPEEAVMAAAWNSLFPNQTLPDTIAGPCCAQFAVSRERIQATSLTRYIAYRNWLIDTPLSDHVSGRVFEYLWQKILGGHAVLCPNMRVCYCDGYGVCFEDEREFDHWFEVKYKKRVAEKMLEEWNSAVKELERVKETVSREFGKKGVRVLEGLRLRVPAVDADTYLIREIQGYERALEERRLSAINAGRDPRVRAKIAGRRWNGGDGF